MTPRRDYFRFLDWFARLGAVVVASVTSAVIFGWLLNIALLMSALPGLVMVCVQAEPEYEHD